MMSDNVLIALIAAIPGILTAIAAFVNSLRKANTSEVKQIAEKVERLETSRPFVDEVKITE